MAEGDAAGAARTTDPAPASGVQTRRSARVLAREAASKVPTRYLTAIATGLFLAATAAFGGLADAPPEPAPVPEPVALGDTYETGRYAITFQNAVLVDTWDPAHVYPEEGERVLILIADVTAEGPDAVTYSSFLSSFVGEELPVDDITGGIWMQGTRFDDETASPTLQPGVTTPLMLAWAVPADRYAAGDEVAFTLLDQERQELSFLASGSYWEETGESAAVSLVLEDIGA